MARYSKKNRSENYQWILMESPYAPDKLTEFSDANGLTGRINVSNYNELRYELQEKLRKARWRIIETQLTPRQREVLKLVSEGYTQTEIAKKLNVNQSSITKSINGNCDYKNGRRVYGGAKKKLKRIAALDEEIRELEKALAELEDENT